MEKKINKFPSAEINGGTGVQYWNDNRPEFMKKIKKDISRGTTTIQVHEWTKHDLR